MKKEVSFGIFALSFLLCASSSSLHRPSTCAECVPFKSPGLQDRKVQHETKKKKKRKTLLSRDSVICKPSGQSTARPSLYNVRFSSETLQQGSITTALTHTHTHKHIGVLGERPLSYSFRRWSTTLSRGRRQREGITPVEQ